jgi:hypothetical protein
VGTGRTGSKKGQEFCNSHGTFQNWGKVSFAYFESHLVLSVRLSKLAQVLAVAAVPMLVDYQ